MQTMQPVQAKQPIILYTTSYTPMLPGTRWHMRRDDFVDICDGDVACADALRYFEMRCHYLGEDLRQEHDIPEDTLPADDDLWVDASVRQIERGTLHAQGKSTYALRLAEEPKDEDAISLVKLGFLKRRIIARCDEKVTQLAPKTTRWRDKAGEFVIVLDRHGNYIASDGSQQNAICDGYGRVVWQYLYCIDTINVAIAKRAWMESPPPMKRSPPIIGRSDALKKNGMSARATMISPAAEHARDSNIRGGSSDSMLSRNQDNIELPDLSRGPSVASYNLESLRTAPWCAETLIGLSSAVLAVPDSTACDEDVWQREWAKPAERLINKTAQMSPQDAWRYLEDTMCYIATPDSPSWWQRPYDPQNPKEARAKKTPITLRHVADNLESQHADMLAKHWQPSTTTPYDGPPIIEECTDYGAGYAGVEEPREATLPVEEIEVVAGQDEVSEEAARSPVVGMDDEELRQLRLQIVEDFPVTLLHGVEPVAPGLSLLYIEYALNCFLEFRRLQEWMEISAEDWLLIEEQAIPWAAAKLAQGPPGNTKESEEGP